ncbi:MAG: Cof-type HAD-IIB family hydrolase [Acidobacteria bacterium]|nr:Cof-type HAD-IIB family hydrolase [Acidobacteriota bacterium]
MAIKLIALDIDGTLLTYRSELTARTRAALTAAQAQGVTVALVTGRRFGSAYQLIQELGLDVLLVTHNGALTKDCASLATLDYHPLAADTARAVAEHGRAAQTDTICNDDPHGHGVMVMEKLSDENGALHRYLAKYWDSVRHVPDLIEYLDHDPIQMMFSGHCDAMETFAASLEEAMTGRVQLFKTRYRSIDLTILDVLSTTASKGASVAALAAQQGIAREEVMAIGDNFNDLTMLRYAGKPLVMGNAEDELKALGFELTDTNEADGVAKAIEKYVLL